MKRETLFGLVVALVLAGGDVAGQDAWWSAGTFSTTGESLFPLKLPRDWFIADCYPSTLPAEGGWQTCKYQQVNLCTVRDTLGREVDVPCSVASPREALLPVPEPEKQEPTPKRPMYSPGVSGMDGEFRTLRFFDVEGELCLIYRAGDFKTSVLCPPIYGEDLRRLLWLEVRIRK